MNISKELAKSIADKLTEKAYTKVADLEANFKKCVTDIVKRTVPKEVDLFFQKHKEYTVQQDYVYLIGNGFGHKFVSLTETVPIVSTYFQVSKESAKILITLHRKYEDAHKHYKNLLAETKQALLTLKTFNRIKKEFPEAAEFLPENNMLPAVINLTQIRKQINAV